MGLFSIPDSASTSKTHSNPYPFALGNIISREQVCQFTPSLNLKPADIIGGRDILIKCQLYAVTRSIDDVEPYLYRSSQYSCKEQITAFIFGL